MIHHCRLAFVGAGRGLLLASALLAWTPTPADEILQGFRAAEEALADDLQELASSRYLEALAAVTAADLAPERRRELGPEVDFAVRRVVDLASTSGAHDRAATVLQSLAERPTGLPPTVGDLARYHAARSVLAMTGDTVAAKALAEPLGFLRAWRVIGPFDNERGTGFLTAYPPEGEIDLAASYEGKKRPVAWRELPAEPVLGDVDLDELLDPNDEACAYALTFVYSPRDRVLALRFGSDEGLRAWVNGRLVASSDVERRRRFDQEAVPLPLRAGWNAVLVKVAEARESWGFLARLTELDGSPATDWHEGEPAPEELAALGAEVAAASRAAPDAAAELSADLPRPEQSTLDALRRRVEENPTDSRAWILLGAILSDLGAHDVDEHPDTEAVRRALEIDDTSASSHLLLADTLVHRTDVAAQRDDNDWRRALEAAAERGSASAALQLASYYVRVFGNVTVAESWVRRARALGGISPNAILLEDQIRARAGFPVSADASLRRLSALAPESPAVRLREAARSLDRGRASEGEAILRGLLERDRWQTAPRAALVASLLERDEVAEARAIVAAELALRPFAHRVPRRLAEIARGRDDLETAHSDLERALAIRPEDPALHAEIAELRWELDRRAGALAAWRRSLELQPNQPEVRRRIEFIEAQESPFENEFRRDGETIARAAIASGFRSETGEPARTLLDNKVIEVHRDGTKRQYHQLVVQILSDLGARSFDSYATAYSDGEQIVEFRRARVHRQAGGYEDGRLASFGTERVGGTPSWRRAGVDLPPLAVGDVLEVEYITEDVVQSFFGDYFGHRELFRSSLATVEKVFRLRVPSDRRFHFHQRRVETEPKRVENAEAGTVTWTWTARDTEKVDREPGMPPAGEIFPFVDVSTFADWDEFSHWYWNLIRKQFETSPEIDRKVEELVSGKDSEIERIRALYEFVVTEVRYNAWEFGVHGFKPYNAAKVFARRFGDCKDKATLLSVMLDRIGVKAYPVLIHAGNQRGEEDLTLPMVNHFNHCITWLPPANDRADLYLDGTASFHGLEQLPSMDRGAEVLIVRDDGGSVQQIPWNEPGDLASDEDWTVRFESQDGRVTESTPATIELRLRATGDYAVNIRRSFEIEAQRGETLTRIFGRRFAGASVLDSSFSDLSDLSQPVEMAVRLRVPRLVDETPEGPALAMPADFFQSLSSLSLFAAQEDREHDVILGTPRRSRIRSTYVLPPSTRVRSAPASRGLEGRFGSFQLEIETASPERLTIEQRIELSAPRVSLADYEAFGAFASEIDQVKNEKIILENGAAR